MTTNQIRFGTDPSALTGSVDGQQHEENGLYRAALTVPAGRTLYYRFETVVKGESVLSKVSSLEIRGRSR